MQQLTYQQQLDLVSKGLAKASVDGNLTTFKYARKVMSDYLWDKHPELKLCRGQVYDNTNGNLVNVPPRKSSNYLENSTWQDKPFDTKVELYKKYNGFMACASVYKGVVIVSTTGSTKSDYAKLAKGLIDIEGEELHGSSWLYEICDESDPHIVSDSGVFLLGYTNNYGDYRTGNFVPLTPDSIKCSLERALELVEQDKGEGFMMYDTNDMSDFCKLKTPYYIGKRKLMRAGDKTVNTMYNKPAVYAEGFPTMWGSVISCIVNEYTETAWACFSAQTRRKVIEQILGG
jgi:hypothetical protein